MSRKRKEPHRAASEFVHRHNLTVGQYAELRDLMGEVHRDGIAVGRERALTDRGSEKGEES